MIQLTLLRLSKPQARAFLRAHDELRAPFSIEFSAGPSVFFNGGNVTEIGTSGGLSEHSNVGAFVEAYGLDTYLGANLQALALAAPQPSDTDLRAVRGGFELTNPRPPGPYRLRDMLSDIWRALRGQEQSAACRWTQQRQRHLDYWTAEVWPMVWARRVTARGEG